MIQKLNTDSTSIVGFQFILLKAPQVITAKLLLAFVTMITLSTWVHADTPSLNNPTKLAAARFLNQSTLGFSELDIDLVTNIGLQNWLNQQYSLPPTTTQPYIDYLASRVTQDLNEPNHNFAYHKVTSAGNNVGYKNLSTAWMRAVIGGDDALRQRVAWALSQILVTSTKTNKLAQGMSNYYDLLLHNAFLKYEDLLLAVTYHPVMGRYLSYMGNRKANPKQNRYPDENYAREVMQLFTIGLWQLNPDGTRVLDSDGEPIPTYSNADIAELARVFTGFWLKNTRFGRIDWNKFDEPMSISSWKHDKLSKKALNGYISVPKSLTSDKEIEYVIQRLARHPNTAPFISRKLISHLVTSNPSASYVQRVSTVWEKTDGLLKDVITAILLDPEAREPRYATAPHFGRLKDPILRVTNLLIGFNCGSDLGTQPTDYPGLQWWRPDTAKIFYQAPMRAPSVFNFFESTYTRPGPIAEQGLVSPEFQILNDATAATVPNYLLHGLTTSFHTQSKNGEAAEFNCDLKPYSDLSTSDLIDKANLVLAGGTLEARSSEAILEVISNQPDQIDRTISTIFAVAISPAAAIQR